MTIAEAYETLLTAPTDIQAHIPVLRVCATGKRVVEFGTRRGVSTMAMLAGRPLSLTSYDLVRTEDVATIEQMAEDEGLDFVFMQADIDKLEHIPVCDFVFIDAMHNGDSVSIQLKLARDAGATKIAMHDTAIFGRVGDLPGTPGILDAVDAFLAYNHDWAITHQTSESYGLTIISLTP